MLEYRRHIVVKGHKEIVVGVWNSKANITELDEHYGVYFHSVVVLSDLTGLRNGRHGLLAGVEVMHWGQSEFPGCRQRTVAL